MVVSSKAVVGIILEEILIVTLSTTRICLLSRLDKIDGASSEPSLELVYFTFSLFPHARKAYFV